MVHWGSLLVGIVLGMWIIPMVLKMVVPARAAQ